jgi:hypothetical protein
MATEIVITIEDGKVEVDINGAVGKGCHAIQEGFNAAFAGKQTHVTRKREFNAPSLEKKRLNQ